MNGFDISNLLLVFGSQSERDVFETICMASNFLKETMFRLESHSPLPNQRSKNTLSFVDSVPDIDVLATIVMEGVRQICVFGLQLCSLSRLWFLHCE